MLVIEPKEITLDDGRSLFVRAAYPTDAPALLLSMERINREGFLLANERGEARLAEARQLIDRHRDKARALLLVAVDRARIAGACGLSPDPTPRAGHVLELGLFVLPAWRGSGLAATLLDMALAWAREAGYRKVALGVLASNGRAISFYRKMGFAPEGLRRGQYLIADRLEDELLMALPLDG
jgi:RimJ/RimL family protein N-acetyltransferase